MHRPKLGVACASDFCHTMDPPPSLRRGATRRPPVLRSPRMTASTPAPAARAALPAPFSARPQAAHKHANDAPRATAAAGSTERRSGQLPPIRRSAIGPPSGPPPPANAPRVRAAELSDMECILPTSRAVQPTGQPTAGLANQGSLGTPSASPASSASLVSPSASAYAPLSPSKRHRMARRCLTFPRRCSPRLLRPLPFNLLLLGRRFRRRWTSLLALCTRLPRMDGSQELPSTLSDRHSAGCGQVCALGS